MKAVFYWSQKMYENDVLIAVVENVKVNEDGFARDEELEKRIKYK